MARVKVKLNDRGMQELLTSKAVEADLMERGERVAEAGRASAPRVTGEYADNIEARPERHDDRVVVHVGSSVWYAPIVEANTGNMARALDAGA